MKRIFNILMVFFIVSMLTVPAFAANRTTMFGEWVPGGMFFLNDMLNAQGTVFYVDSNTGTDAAGYGQNPNIPYGTIDYAIGQCTANKGDVILVFPQHAGTIATSITCDVAGVTIIGLGHGNSRPTLTTTAATDCITVTADDVTIANLIFAAPGIDAVTADINIAAARCTVLDTVHHGSTTAMNKVDVITITAAGHDAVLDGVKIYNDTVEVVGGIVLEGAAKRVWIENCMVFDSIGFTNGSLSDEATALGLVVKDSYFTNAKADTVNIEFGNNTTGMMINCFSNGRHTTIASNIAAGTGMAFYETYTVEEAAKNGLLMPVVDAD